MGAAGNPFRIVVVDDNERVRRVVSELIAIDGRFRLVGVAENGQDGVHMVCAERPDVVLLDMQMPLMTGAEAIPRIRAGSPSTLIVLFSSSPRLLVPAAGVDADLAFDKAHEISDVLDQVVARLA